MLLMLLMLLNGNMTCPLNCAAIRLIMSEFEFEFEFEFVFVFVSKDSWKPPPPSLLYCKVINLS